MERGERERFAAMLADTVPKGPKIVNIHLGNVCNLRCNFCWYHSPLVTYNEKKGFTDFGVMKSVVDDCADMEVEMISLESDGEVFVVPYSMDLIRHILSKGIRLKIFTNATFDPQYTEELWAVEEFLVNFSTVNKEQYMHIYGKDCFDLVYNNLKNMKSKLSIAYVITKDNFETMPDYVRFISELPVKKIEFKMMEATTETQSLVVSAKKEFLKKVVETMHALKDADIDTNIVEIFKLITGEDYFTDIENMEKAELHNDRHLYFRWDIPDRCYVGYYMAFIDFKGRVLAPCDGVGIDIIGNIHDKSFKELWHSEMYQKSRGEAKYCFDKKHPKWKECRYCNYRSMNRKIDAEFNKYQKLIQVEVKK